MEGTKGILWLSATNQQPPVLPAFECVAKHFHVTLQFGVNWEDVTVKRRIGEVVMVEVLENCFAADGSIQALRVKLPPDFSAICQNLHPHMTISMAKGVKPVHSNSMLNDDHTFEPIDEIDGKKPIIETVLQFHQFN